MSNFGNNDASASKTDNSFNFSWEVSAIFIFSLFSAIFRKKLRFVCSRLKFCCLNFTISDVSVSSLSCKRSGVSFSMTEICFKISLFSAICPSVRVGILFFSLSSVFVCSTNFSRKSCRSDILRVSVLMMTSSSLACLLRFDFASFRGCVSSAISASPKVLHKKVSLSSAFILKKELADNSIGIFPNTSAIFSG